MICHRCHKDLGVHSTKVTDFISGITYHYHQPCAEILHQNIVYESAMLFIKLTRGTYGRRKLPG